MGILLNITYKYKAINIYIYIYIGNYIINILLLEFHSQHIHHPCRDQHIHTRWPGYNLHCLRALLGDHIHTLLPLQVWNNIYQELGLSRSDDIMGLEPHMFHHRHNHMLQSHKSCYNKLFFLNRMHCFLKTKLTQYAGIS